MSKAKNNPFIRLFTSILNEVKAINAEKHIRFRLLEIPKLSDKYVIVQICGKYGKHKREVDEIFESGDILNFPTLDVIFLSYIKTLREQEEKSTTAKISWHKIDENKYLYTDLASGEVSVRNPEEILKSGDFIRLTKQEVRDVSYASGFNAGYKLGFEEGYLKGELEGYQKGYNTAKIEESLKNENKWQIKGTWESEDNIYFELYSATKSRRIVVDITKIKTLFSGLSDPDIFQAGVLKGRMDSK